MACHTPSVALRHESFPSRFLAAGAVASATAALGAKSSRGSQAPATRFPEVPDEALYAALARPVLDARSRIADRVIIGSIDLLKVGREHVLRVRTKDGAESISFDNGRIATLHPSSPTSLCRR